MHKRILFLIAAFLTFIFIIVLCHITFLVDDISDVDVLDNNWRVTVNDDVYEDTYLPTFVSDLGRRPGKDDVITFERTIKKNEKLQFPTLQFLSRVSCWEVFYNDQLLDSENMDKIDSDEYIGTNYAFVSLPLLTEDGTLKLRVYPHEDNAYPSFESPVIADYDLLMRVFFFKNLFSLASGIFLIIFGFTFFIISLMFYKTMPEILSQLFSSLLFITVGLWILSYFRLHSIFIKDSEYSTALEYYALYLMIPLIYSIIGCIQGHYKDWIFMVIAITSAVICLFLFVMHRSNVAHVNTTITYYQAIALVCVLFLCVTIARDVIAKKLAPSEAIQLIGLGFLIGSFFLHFIFHELEIKGIIPINMNTRRAIPIGGLSFVFATLINYFIYLSESYAHRKEYASLTHLAYADGLTDLPNRSRYEKYMKDLDNSSENYCIVSLDLNGLKEINDNDGHACGDRYLQEFATVLQQCFENKAFLARIGGDEFVAILTKGNWEEVDSILTRLNDALEVKNVLYPSYRRSVATGYALKSEVPDGNSHEVYLLADKRMYQKKKMMHEKMGIAARI